LSIEPLTFCRKYVILIASFGLQATPKYGQQLPLNCSRLAYQARAFNLHYDMSNLQATRYDAIYQKD
jgi:hypothetical protein